MRISAPVCIVFDSKFRKLLVYSIYGWDFSTMQHFILHLSSHCLHVIESMIYAYTYEHSKSHSMHSESDPRVQLFGNMNYLLLLAMNWKTRHQSMNWHTRTEHGSNRVRAFVYKSFIWVGSSAECAAQKLMAANMLWSLLGGVLELSPYGMDALTAELTSGGEMENYVYGYTRHMHADMNEMKYIPRNKV